MARINIEAHVASVPSNFRDRYAKALRGKLGKAGALKLKCYECCNFEDVYKRVANCTVKICPLWAYRPRPRIDSDAQGSPKPIDSEGS
jgi:hypothetical protein